MAAQTQAQCDSSSFWYPDSISGEVSFIQFHNFIINILIKRQHSRVGRTWETLESEAKLWLMDGVILGSIMNV